MARSGAARVLEGLKQTVYSGPLKKVIRRTGMNSHLRSAYDRVFLTTVGGRVTCEVDDATAEFRLTSRSEYNRVTDVPGPGRPTLESLLGELRPNDVFYEIGANVGVISCLVGDLLPEGHVVAFEPHPGNAARLRAHLRNNDVTSSVYEVALSDSQGELELAIPANHIGVGGSSIASNRYDDRITTEMTTGDALVEHGDIPRPTVVYIDAEGAELRVIRGLRAELERDDCRLLHCSVHAQDGEGNSIKDHGDTPEELHDELRELGFFLHEVPVEGSDNYMLVARI